MAEPDLSLLLRQNERVLTEIGSVRDDLAVLIAIVMRHDATLAAILNELRAMHTQSA